MSSWSLGQTEHAAQTGQTSQIGRTGQTDLTLKPDFPDNLRGAAFAIHAMFLKKNHVERIAALLLIFNIEENNGGIDQKMLVSL